jgi:hemoglobin
MKNEITSESIYELVDKFYAKIRVHPELGKIFNNAVENWEEHTLKVTEFWKGVMLGEGNYAGGMPKAHLKLPNFSLSLFDEWLRLFHETSTELFTPQISKDFIAKSTSIAFNLKNLLSHKQSKTYLS